VDKEFEGIVWPSRMKKGSESSRNFKL